MCWEWCGTPFGHKEDQAAIAKANTIHEGTGPAALVTRHRGLPPWAAGDRGT
jgi:hypothetical protein